MTGIVLYQAFPWSALYFMCYCQNEVMKTNNEQLEKSVLHKGEEHLECSTEDSIEVW